MALSPVLQQYLDIKKQYDDCILFFRIGDFYEMYFDDAKVGSKVLDLRLTEKTINEQQVYKCGFPFYLLEERLADLVKSGYKVAVCEQTNEETSSKVVKREVVKVVTPGTIVSSNYLDNQKNNYLMSIYCLNNSCGISAVDISTGEFLIYQLDDILTINIIDEISRFSPSEIISNNVTLCKEIKNNFSSLVNCYHNSMFEYNSAYNSLCKQFSKEMVDKSNLSNYKLAVSSAGAIILYLLETQKGFLRNIVSFELYNVKSNMILDLATRKNLELLETIQDRSKKGSLLWVLDKTKTALGARLLRKWIEKPETNIRKIEERLKSVEELNSDINNRNKIIDCLKTIADIERLVSRISSSVKVSDLLTLKATLAKLPLLYELLISYKSYYLKKIYNHFDTSSDLCELLSEVLYETSDESNQIIKSGYDTDLDNLRNVRDNSIKSLKDLEQKEKEKLGIKNLHIISSREHYYIEIKKADSKSVPDNYIKRDETKSVDRYVTSELENIEATILSSSQNIEDIETKILKSVQEEIIQQIPDLRELSNLIAILDIFQSFAVIAMENKYVRPSITSDNIIDIKQGKHPVVEKSLGNFVPNDCYLDLDSNRVHIVTGPNMAGKSTYMRQVALICIMAQVGSFVPAESVSICPVDRIYTRIGASDNLSAGKSTFMVEMSEVANILNNDTKNSLILFDEIGRGTSTFDGLSIAHAILNYLSKRLKFCKVLFSTHYHELTKLENELDGVVNYFIEVEEKDGSIIFKRTIKKGVSDKSYGVHVAKLAGLPEEVIKDATNILSLLESTKE